jgi:hypothetical protein
MDGRLLIGLLAALGLAALAQETEEPADAEPASEPTTVIDELSQEEIDAELARAEDILDESSREVKEFTDTKPLPADLPLALPSDF